MTLVDTSVWVDHLSVGDEGLGSLLDNREVLSHPFVIGELAVGNLRHRDRNLALLQMLPVAVVATATEVLRFVDQHRLAGIGIGYIDAHLLAAVHLTSGASLWSRDRRLSAAANRLGLAMRLPYQA